MDFESKTARLTNSAGGSGVSDTPVQNKLRQIAELTDSLQKQFQEVQSRLNLSLGAEHPTPKTDSPTSAPRPEQSGLVTALELIYVRLTNLGAGYRQILDRLEL